MGRKQAYLILILLPLKVFGGSAADSLLQLKERAVTDKQKLQINVSLIQEKLRSDDTAGLYAIITEAEKQCSTADAVYRYALSAAKGTFLIMRGDRTGGFGELSHALSLANSIHTDSVLADAYFTIGNNYFHYDSYTVALRYLLRSESYYKKTKNDRQVALVQRQCGIIHSTLGSYKEAIRLYEASAGYWERVKDKKSLGQIYNNLGNVYMSSAHDSLKAMYYFVQSMYYRKQLNDIKGMGQVYNNIGTLLFNFHHYPEALGYFRKGYDYRIQGETPQSGLIESRTNIGKTLYKMGSVAEARKMLESIAEECSKNPNFIELRRRALEYLKDIYLEQKDYQRASETMLEYYTLRDSMYDRDKTSQLVKASMSAEFEKRLMEDSLRNSEKEKRAEIEKQKEAAVQVEKDKRQRMMLAFLTGGILVLIGVAFLLYKRNEEKKRTNELITQQRDQLRTKQKEIIDSITYAKKIQQSQLASEKYIEKTLKRLRKG